MSKLEISNRKTTSLIEACLAEVQTQCDIRKVLVVGCGSGMEAGVIADHMKAETVGIDISLDTYDPGLAGLATIMAMDAEFLQFENDSVDFIYSFHALEHITHPEKALSEMARVLRPGGIFCVGTPNRRRIVGYLGSSTPLLNKIMWNLSDLRMRLTGRWRNELGAHAGFTAQELGMMCKQAFGDARNISGAYYDGLQGRTAQISRLANAAGLAWLIEPCVYFCGTLSPVQSGNSGKADMN